MEERLHILNFLTKVVRQFLVVGQQPNCRLRVKQIAFHLPVPNGSGTRYLQYNPGTYGTTTGFLSFFSFVPLLAVSLDVVLVFVFITYGIFKCKDTEYFPYT